MVDKPLQYSLSDIKLRMLLLLKDSENYDMEFYQVYFPAQKCNSSKALKEETSTSVVYQPYAYIIISVYSIIKIMMLTYYDKIIIFFISICNT